MIRYPEGFTALNYDKDITIAANGSTIVDLYYDRCYYLLGQCGIIRRAAK